MQIDFDTTIQNLYDTGVISVRTYNCLRYAGLATIEEVMNFAVPRERLLKLRNFGKKSFEEIVPLLEQVRIKNSIPVPTTAEEVFGMVGDTIAAMMRDAYDMLFVENDKVIQCFKNQYPSVADLHCAVMGDIEALMRIISGFSEEDNKEYRGLFIRYLDEAINRMVEGQRSRVEICMEYMARRTQLENILTEFSYKDKVDYFMTPCAHNFFNSVYIDMCEKKLSVRAKNFVHQVAPNFEDLVPYFEAPLAKYKMLCPGQSMKKTLTEVFNFNQQLKNEFDRYWPMTDEELQVEIVKRDFPYLNSVERRFVIEHRRSYGINPLFFILYNYMRISELRNDKVFSLYYGIFDDKERSIDELAQIMGLTRERIRQIITNKQEVQDTELITTDEWVHYEKLLSLPFITSETKEYQDIKNRENLQFDFRVFARLTQLLGDHYFNIAVKNNERITELHSFPNQYEAEVIGNVAIVINQKKVPSINVRECVDSLNELVSSRYTNDTYIRIESCLNGVSDAEKNDAIDIMTYIAKEALGLEVNMKREIYVRKNYIDIAEDLYNILMHKGEPMSLDELYEAFKLLYPNHKYTDASQIRPFLLRHPRIKPIGRSSRYGLDSWNIFYGTIRDLLIEQLEDVNTPLHIEQLYEAVCEHYPNTSIRSLETTMKDDSLNRFVQFNDGFYGLKSKQYDDAYEQINAERQRFRFDERFIEFRRFIEAYNRYPVSSNGAQEASLYRWLYNVQNDILDVTDIQKQQLEEAMKQDEQEYIPRNALENDFRNNCRDYKAYINSHYALPTITTEPDLYNWMMRSKANYDSYVDHRRKYLTDLFNYILSLGFSI